MVVADPPWLLSNTLGTGYKCKGSGLPPELLYSALSLSPIPILYTYNYTLYPIHIRYRVLNLLFASISAGANRSCYGASYTSTMGIPCTPQ